MAVVTIPDFTPRQIPSGRFAFLLVVLLLGLLSFAAVKSLTADCANQYLVADDGVTRLTSDEGKFLVTGPVWLRVGGAAILLPEGLQPVLAKLGLMPTECR